MTRSLSVVLVSTYEMGRQPFGLASPAAWLAERGASVEVWDLDIVDVDPRRLSEFDLFGFYLPMHTATRLAVPVIERVRENNPGAHIAAFGIYAPMNEAYLRELGVDTVLGGEFEEDLVDLYSRLGQDEPVKPVDPEKRTRLRLKVPDRSGLPALSRYAKLQMPDGETRTVGYTEASRGCKHMCRHCPVVPAYQGRFNIVSPEVVLADIANQVAAGAEHITFGDPDFFNGPAHAVRVVEAMKEAFPSLTYDATIKIEHLADRIDLIGWLQDTGCVFVTTAMESFDNSVLEILDKGHTVDDFVRVLEESRRVGLPIAPTFVAFTPWTTLETYGELLGYICDLGLVDAVAPIQYGIKLLIPEGSLLLELPEVDDLVDPFDAESLSYPWAHPDPDVDRLQEAVMAVVRHTHEEERRVLFDRVRAVAAEFGATTSSGRGADAEVPALATIPYMTEPWYC
jgi:radical SAM superfamily enzyme YgiQ (UPF0313 family)